MKYEIGTKIATREAYGNALAEFGADYDIVVFDADLAASTKTGTFKKSFPDRFFDCGIAEANMMAVAAGAAATGKIPFASSFAMFAAGRAYEQIRNSIGYPHLNVKIGATHAGITVGEDGATHQCNDDLALMRTIPGMVIHNPSDAVEARAAVLAAIKYNGPVYLRFGRLAVPVINDQDTYEFEIGKGQLLKEGTDVTVVATGLMVNEAIEAEKILVSEAIEKKYIDENFSDPELSLEKLSGEFSYNKKYLSSAFKKLFRVSLSDYLCTVRINHACVLIDRNYKSISDIAFLCGFSDPMHFSKVFKKKMTMSPREYIKSRNV